MLKYTIGLLFLFFSFGYYLLSNGSYHSQAQEELIDYKLASNDLTKGIARVYKKTSKKNQAEILIGNRVIDTREYESLNESMLKSIDSIENVSVKKYFLDIYLISHQNNINRQVQQSKLNALVLAVFNLPAMEKELFWNHCANLLKNSELLKEGHSFLKTINHSCQQEICVEEMKEFYLKNLDGISIDKDVSVESDLILEGLAVLFGSDQEENLNFLREALLKSKHAPKTYYRILSLYAEKNKDLSVEKLLNDREYNLPALEAELPKEGPVIIR